MPKALDQANITTLKGVGPALADKLAKIGITTLQDILFHLPIRYEDRTRLTPIGSLRPGDTVVVEGEVKGCDVTFGRRRSLLVLIQDQTGLLALRFFHFSKAQQNGLARAGTIRCFGEIRKGAAGLEMYHPEYTTETSALEDTLTPIYPSTEGLTQARQRSLVDQVIKLMDQGQVVQNLGGQYPELSTPDINSAVKLAHRPGPGEDLASLTNATHPALLRLAFEELLAHHISMRLLRQKTRENSAIAMNIHSKRSGELLANLGFQLTAAQQRVVEEINEDLSMPRPMLRLVQGDVGSGKTVVAALASIISADNRLQTAVMAPTEILAEQHFINFTNWLSPLGLQVGWLTGKLKGNARATTLEAIHSGQFDVIVGTHALFQQDVEFNKLGLMIVDEQHRFGVEQRLSLRAKGAKDNLIPHQLVMTATPIPRTLTMSLYADMDCSVIDELPPGRKPITTTVLSDQRRADVVERIESACKQGAQAYWVCTLIEESEVLQCQAAEVTAEELKSALPGLNIGLIHGRMKAVEKTDIMTQFTSGQIDLLVATTVIEVGVDVPNASLMVIENPERLGLAQLHQLRGRVGRGSRESYCLLLYRAPLSELAKQRLQVMRESQDGFYIADQDLKIRGPGEIFGTRQSGNVEFKIADLIRDSEMLPDVRRLADELIANDQATATALMARWLVEPEVISQV